MGQTATTLIIWEDVSIITSYCKNLEQKKRKYKFNTEMQLVRPVLVRLNNRSIKTEKVKE